MSRTADRHVTFAALLLSLLLFGCATPSTRDLREVTVESLQHSMNHGELSSAELVDWYLERIETVDRAGPRLNAIIELNPDARAQAVALDRERATSGPRGPLHGIPVVLKANIDTGDRMATTAGSLALKDFRAPDDARLVAALRDAGAVILAKANLSEWANFRSLHSSSGWSSLGGQTGNAYDPDRNPCGSSSGSAVAVAANLTVLAVGTETDGSIVCPAGSNGIVGIKPTLGLVSRDGIIPIAHSQDTAGPMARTVRDAALLLDVLAAPGPGDTAVAGRPDPLPGFADGLATARLEGTRIGVLRAYGGAGSHPGVDALFHESVRVLEDAGAVLVDPVELDSTGAWNAELQVLLYEFRSGLADWLDMNQAPLRTLDELIAFNERNADTVMPIFGQDLFVSAAEKGDLDSPAYQAALAESKRIMRDAIDGALVEHRLDAIVAPTNGPAWLTDHVNGDTFSIGSSSFAAVAGYPNVTVPAGFVGGLPIGLSIFGAAWNDATVIAIAHAFEQVRKARRAPTGY